MASPGPPLHRTGIVASGVAVIAATYGLVRFGYGLHLPAMAAEFTLSTTTSGVIAAGSFLSYCVAAAVAARLIARGRARSALWTACAAASAGSLAIAVSWTPAVLAAGVLLSGSGAGAASPALVTAVALTVRSPAAADRAQAVVNAGTGLGVVGAGLTAVLAPGAWRPAWAVAAVACLLAGAWADRSTRWSASPPRAAPAASGTVRHGDLVRPVLAAGLAGAGSAATWTFGRELLGDTGGLAPRTTALLWCALGAAGVLGALSSAAVHRVGVRTSWTGTVLITAAATALLAALPWSIPAVGLGLVLFGAAYTALSGVLISWGSELRPHAPGRATATLFIALTVGQAAGAVLLGGLAGWTGITTAFLVAAALGGCAALFSTSGAGRRSQTRAAEPDPAGVPGRGTG